MSVIKIPDKMSSEITVNFTQMMQTIIPSFDIYKLLNLRLFFKNVPCTSPVEMGDNVHWINQGRFSAHVSPDTLETFVPVRFLIFIITPIQA